MKAIVMKDKELLTIEVEYYKQGQKPEGLWVATLLGRVEYTVEDLGDYQCVLRRYERFRFVPIEESTMDIEYGDNAIHLGLALTKNPADKE